MSASTGWQYSTYILEDDPSLARRNLLRLHIKEVMDTLANPTSQTIDGLSYNRQSLESTITKLKAELLDLEQRLALRKPSAQFLRARLRG